MRLMNREEMTDPLPPPPSPTAVEQFNQGNQSVGPLDTNFVIDLANPFTTKWNKAVVKIFTDNFVKSHSYKCKDKKEIRERFSNHMKYLMTVYRQQTKSSGSDDLAADGSRRISVRRHRRKLHVSILHSVLVFTI